MTLIKLTENRYIDSDNISEVQFHPDAENPILEITYKHHESLAGFRLFGGEAEEAWENFKSRAYGKGYPQLAN